MYKIFKNPVNVISEERIAKYIISEGYMFIYPLSSHSGICYHADIANREFIPFNKVEGGGNLKITCCEEFLLITKTDGCSEKFGCPKNVQTIHKELLECRTVTYIDGQYYKIETIDEYKEAKKFSNDFRFMHIIGLEHIYMPFNEFLTIKTN